MPTVCIPVEDGGVGFDYRLHMAVADKWVEIIQYASLKTFTTSFLLAGIYHLWVDVSFEL